MKIIVAHKSPDLDAISSMWFIKRFLNGWQDAKLAFVPAGSKLEGNYATINEIIDTVDGNQVIHVDTGNGPLDHHNTQDDSICAASLTFDFISTTEQFHNMHETKQKALSRMAKVVVFYDHFKEVFIPNPTDDYHDFTLYGILEGLEFEQPQADEKTAEFIFLCLDAIYHTFENKIFAENEIREKGIEFTTSYGKALGIETINDTCIKLAQKMGYEIVVRKDPYNEKVRIKARPDEKGSKKGVDLTKAYEILKEKDPEASWFLHVSKKMLLNGSSKNPTMKGSKLTLSEVIEVLKSL